MGVQYKIYKNLEKRDEEPIWDGTFQCFHNLKGHYKELPAEGGIHYLVAKTVSEEIVKWYHKKLNLMGFKSRFHIGEKYYNFYIQKQSTYLKILCILCSIRYLEEAPFPKMIEWLYAQSQTYPKISFFELFQLMHHIFNAQVNFNWNHAFLQPAGSIYNEGKIEKIITLKSFINNIDNHVPKEYTNGLNFVMVSKIKIEGKDNGKKILNLIKEDKIEECLKFMREDKNGDIQEQEIVIQEKEDINFGLIPIFLGA